MYKQANKQFILIVASKLFRIESRKELFARIVCATALVLAIPHANAQVSGYEACVRSPDCGIFIDSHVVQEGDRQTNAFDIRVNFELLTSFEGIEPIFLEWQTFQGGSQPASTDDYMENRDLPIALLSSEYAGRNSVITRYVGIRDDSRVEPDETFLVRLFSPRADLIKRSEAVFTIIDNDASPDLPRISIHAEPITEGEPRVFVRVMLDRPSTREIRVGFATIPGTAIPGLDYVGTSAGRMIDPGVTVAAVNVGIIDDDEYEPIPETLSVRIRSVSGAVIDPDRRIAEVVIIDNDSAPGNRYADVPLGHWAFDEISRFAEVGIAGECGSSPSRFCPATLLRNDVMSLWLVKALEGAKFQPPAANGNRFNDVSTTTWAASWIENVDARGISHGCNDYQLFCPSLSMTRAAFAYTLVRARYGSTYSPAPATGEFDDVPVTHWAAPYIEQLKRDGVLTGGCQADPRKYCPGIKVTRAWAAWMIVRTFGL